jgi:exodeoxyribonuclease VII large subunit
VSRRFFALSDVTERVAELLRPAFGRSFWVRAEISSGRERGHFYCDLVETDARGEVVAQMRCTLWARDLERIRSEFKQAGLDLVLENGTQIGIECSVQFHPRYGLSLVGRDMDPAFALGELELKRRRILLALETEGLLGRNALLPAPLLPNRIALITSPGSAAYEDFVQTLSASAFGFRIYVAAATMQGQDTERTVLAALERCAALPVDLVVIARGGGSKTELAWLDNEAIARRIARYPLPVWTGIGHETDISVLDAVAGQAFKTPTAAAEALVGRFLAVARRLSDTAGRLRSVWALRRDAEQERVRRGRIGLRQGSRKLLDQRKSELMRAAEGVRAEVRSRLGQAYTHLAEARSILCARTRATLRQRGQLLIHASQSLARGSRAAFRMAREGLSTQRVRFSLRRIAQRIETERKRLVDREQAIRAADPATALRRGFSITQNAAGELLRSVAQVAGGEIVTTRLSDGRFESQVIANRRDADG